MMSAMNGEDFVKKEESSISEEPEYPPAPLKYQYLPLLSLMMVNRKNERESRTLKEKTVAVATTRKGKSKKNSHSKAPAKEKQKAAPAQDLSLYAVRKSYGSRRKLNSEPASNDTPRHGYNTRRDSSHEQPPLQLEGQHDARTPQEEAADLKAPPQRTPQLFGLGSDMRMPEAERHTPNIFALSSSEFDLRSPGLGFLLNGNKMNKLFDEPHFLKPTQVGKNQFLGMKDDDFESPRQGNLLMTPEIMQPQNRAPRKSSFESYFHLLRKDTDNDTLMKKITSPSTGGFKLRSPNLASNKIDGIASYLNLNGSNQGLESFQLEDSAKDDRNNEMSNNQLNITIELEPEPGKKVKMT